MPKSAVPRDAIFLATNINGSKSSCYKGENELVIEGTEDKLVSQCHALTQVNLI